MKKTLVSFAVASIIGVLPAQTPADSMAFFIRRIYDVALSDLRSYEWLHAMCTRIGPRMSGSVQYRQAADMLANALDSMGLQTRLQPCTVKTWRRGADSKVYIVSHTGRTELPSAALGHAIGTPAGPIKAPVVEVRDLDHLDALGQAGALKGKIAFLNKAMDPTLVRTFEAYGRSGSMRTEAPGRAGNYGAVAAVVRSLASRIDDYPHTGVTLYGNNTPIPAVAISTRAAEHLAARLQVAPVTLEIYSGASMGPDAVDHNVIGEWKGSRYPDKIILVGGHLDSWDLGQGAHDDGAGCMQAMEALYILKKLGYTPKHTLRCVLFANEESGLAGAEQYAQTAMQLNEYHVAAIESDGGGHTPRGFGIGGHQDVAAEYFRMLAPAAELLETYGLTLSRGGGGADIAPLMPQKGMLIGLQPDSQRYFDYHHSRLDVIDNVHPRELALGSAAMAALIYYIDQTQEHD